MERLFVFHNFHARPGNEEIVGSILREAVAKIRTEPGCRSIQVNQSIRDPAFYLVHSCWTDEESLNALSGLPYVKAYFDRVHPLIHHEFDVTIMHQFG